jgi:hypothetical protein
LWRPEELPGSELPSRFGYVPSPAAQQNAAPKDVAR